MTTKTDRYLFALPALAAAALLAFGYYLQYFQDQDPCPLCLVQRGFYYALIAVFGLAALHGPRRIGAALYCGAALLAALGGGAVAGRQVWLQHLPADQVPACGPDLFFMLKNLPLQRTLEKLFAGSGQCAEVNWKLLGLSIAEWSLAWFAALALYALWLAFRKRAA
ncbi:MAG TPA: disulfide bond formation protein B [Burkholderiales bacterium]|jgi:disulfide bond formation protein DsbB|nr:disulfide bond formation protein B [Burkholderiales bacterium]